MRGKRSTGHALEFRRRITPAHAGKTLGFSFPFDVYKDHPRACGENNNYGECTGFHLGSPPRMRGKRDSKKQLRPRIRITPAHAGKTAIRLKQQSKQRDHPRACGENEEQAQ